MSKRCWRILKRAIILDPNHLPALEAYIESLCMVPSLIGGDIEKAKQFATQLMRLDPVQGSFALGFIASKETTRCTGEEYFSKAFNLLEQQSFCSQNLEEYFAKSSMNLPYKIAETSTAYQLSPATGLCAINYFIEQFSPYSNIPLEWAYFQKAKLLFALGKINASRLAIKASLEINPAFEIAKNGKKPYKIDMKKIHFIAIGGSAMHNLALALKAKDITLAGVTILYLSRQNPA